jgi:hypothetical protein
MISARLVELIQNHAPQLAADTVSDLLTNDRTGSFRGVPRHDLEARIFRIYNHLGDWIAAGHGFAEAEFEEWGRRRFGQGVPLSEILYAVLVMKQHLSRYIGEHGLLDAAFPRSDQDYVLPMHLHSLQELNGMVGSFFDRGLYHLARGYESALAGQPPAPATQS